jgi:hypothetical protein
MEVNGIAIKDVGHLQETVSASTTISKVKVKRADAVVDLAVPVSI